MKEADTYLKRVQKAENEDLKKIWQGGERR